MASSAPSASVRGGGEDNSYGRSGDPRTAAALLGPYRWSCCCSGSCANEPPPTPHEAPPLYYISLVCLSIWMYVVCAMGLPKIAITTDPATDRQRIYLRSGIPKRFGKLPSATRMPMAMFEATAMGRRQAASKFSWPSRNQNPTTRLPSRPAGYPAQAYRLGIWCC
jgi:hypothetical protein